MANRPRRPKTGGRPGTTIDLGAERIEGAAGRDPDETVGASRPDVPAASFETSEPEEASPFDASDNDVSREARTPASSVVTGGADRLDVPPPGDAISAGDAASEEGRVHEAASRIPPKEADEVDPATGEPVPGGAAYDERPEGERPDATVSEDGQQATVAEFAREEGLSETAARPEDSSGAPVPRRDLGEFEDDETVIPTAEPEPAGPDPLATSPYRAGSQPEHRANGFGSLLGAALLGAVLAVAGGAILLYSGMVPVPASQATPAATQQFATAGEVQQVSGDVETLRGAVEQLQSAQAAGGAGSGTVSPADFTQLTDRVAAAERAVQSGGASTGDAASAAAGATEAANAARDAATGAETTANAARDTAAAAQTTAQSAQTAAEAARQAAEAAQATAGQASQSVEEFGGRLAEIEAANKQAAVALAAASLKAAIDRGTPFMGELERYAGASGSGDAVSSLRDFAAAGVPTATALNAGWNDVETRILAALRPADPNAAIGQQVLTGLRSLVTVRPAGSAASPDESGPDAAVARMDAAITSGDYGAWLGEWNGLPDAAKAASQAYSDQVKARVEADGLIDRTLNSAIGASGSEG